MYKTDVPKIISYVKQQGPSGLVDVGSFVLCTIQTPISRSKDLVKDVKKHKESSAALWGHKKAGYEFLVDNQQKLFNRLVQSSPSVLEATELLLNCPSLGLPKASFFLQCLGYNTACLDVHNLKRYDLPVQLTKIGKVSPATRAKKITAYVNAVQVKSSEYHWDSWCAYVAGNRMNKELTTAEAVSNIHYEAISQ